MTLFGSFLVTSAFASDSSDAFEPVVSSESEEEKSKTVQKETKKRTNKKRGGRGRGKGGKTFAGQSRSEVSTKDKEKETPQVNLKKDDRHSTSNDDGGKLDKREEEKEKEEEDKETPQVNLKKDDRHSTSDDDGGQLDKHEEEKEEEVQAGYLSRFCASAIRKTYRVYANTTVSEDKQAKFYLALSLGKLLDSMEYNEKTTSKWEDLIGMTIKYQNGQVGTDDYFVGRLYLYDIAFGDAQLNNLQIKSLTEKQTDELPYDFISKMCQYPGAKAEEFQIKNIDYPQILGTYEGAYYELYSDKGEGTKFVQLHFARIPDGCDDLDTAKILQEALRHRDPYVGPRTKNTVDVQEEAL